MSGNKNTTGAGHGKVEEAPTADTEEQTKSIPLVETEGLVQKKREQGAWQPPVARRTWSPHKDPHALQLGEMFCRRWFLAQALEGAVHRKKK